MDGFPPPRFEREPTGITDTYGDAAIEVAAAVGLNLDPHQQHAMRLFMAVRQDPTNTRKQIWAATQVGFSEPRQNGKTRLLLARKVVGVLLLDEQRIIHSAHEVKTAMESFSLLKDLCLNYDVLSTRVKRVINTNGREGFIFKNGCEISFMARTKGSGRGFSASTILLDEAQQLSFPTFAAMLPTLSAVPNSQMWMFGTPPPPEVNGEVFTRMRSQARAGSHERLAWLEWGAGPVDGDEENYDYMDPRNWIAANPACPSRITLETIQDEQLAMDEDTFRRDRLGEWDSDAGVTVVPEAAWARQADPEGSSSVDQVLAIDVNPARTHAHIALAGFVDSEKQVRHVELVASGPGTDWVGSFLKKTVYENPSIRAVIVDAVSPASSLIEALQTRFGVRVTTIQTRGVAMACGQMYDGFVGGTITHANQDEMNAAMIGSAKRPLVDSWALSRKRAEVDISPFVAGTLALYGVTLKKVNRPRHGQRGRRKVSIAS